MYRTNDVFSMGLWVVENYQHIFPPYMNMIKHMLKEMHWYRMHGWGQTPHVVRVGLVVIRYVMCINVVIEYFPI